MDDVIERKLLRKQYLRDYYQKNKEGYKQRDVEWQKKNKDGRKKINRRAKLKRAYGLTIETYDALLKAQGGCCKLCRTNAPRGRYGRFHVDHDHKTGEVRGLLCVKCNATVGNHSEDFLLLCAEYVAMKGDIL